MRVWRTKAGGPSPPTSDAVRRLPALLWVLVLVLALGHVALVFSIVGATGGEVLARREVIKDVGIVTAVSVVAALASVAGATLGAIVAARRPRNPVGWLLIAAAALGMTAWLIDDYGLLAVAVVPGTLHGVEWAALAITPIGGAWVGAILLAVWLFPTGRVFAIRWRRVLAVALGCLVARTAALLLIPGPVPYAEFAGVPIENPMGLREFGWLSEWKEAIEVLTGIALVLTVAGVVSRFRFSRGEERAQLKWFLYAAVVLMIGFAITRVAELSLAAYPIYVLAVPAAMTVAILRYRLYDIDRLISRTLVYASLTVVLGLVYAGLVIALQGILASFAGGGGLAVAASTLATAALFRPLRSRIQHAVDRRFYRARYDAQHTIEAFTAELRNEVDLSRLTAELGAAVDDALQPASVSVWLRQRAS